MLHIRPLRLCTSLLFRNVRNGAAQDLTRSTLVIAPHQDDETLGCGGTIIRKRQAGAQVRIVFVSDGRRSHAHLMKPDELCAIRRQEAIAAARILGVAAENVSFLDFREGELSLHRRAIRDRLERTMRAHRPADVFVPYRADGHQDHEVTQQEALAALRSSNLNATVYEYPLWIWAHWPWISLPISITRECREAVTGAIRGRLGLRLLTEFRSAVDVRAVLQQKREALLAYRSQMTRLVPDEAWKILPDVSGGEFLDCHFRDHELFRRYPVRGNTTI